MKHRTQSPAEPFDTLTPKAQKAFSYLVGQVMKLSRGTADPEMVKRILWEKLGMGDEA